MTPERYRRIGEIYHAAAGLEEEDRVRFLAEACGGDEELSNEVESLLREADGNRSFLDSPAMEVMAKSMAEDRAKLLIGQALGHYRIVALVGAGGMGEVYRAHDTRLKRDVAVKILPAAYSANVDRMRRFEQEARSAGALNHPNILTIHDIGVHEGSLYIVSELLEGETLRRRLGRALALPKTIEFVLGVVRGLAAAHDKRIVHRDLKPENLFITRDGRVKILDFGLAKLIQPEGLRGVDASTAPFNSDPGNVMGTPGYMSPEQVRGQAVDHRSDIFAFGIIFYEMLSGRAAFSGGSTVERLNAILKEEPPELPDGVAPAIVRILRRCLEKQPEDRFQSTRDLVFHLESLSGQSGPLPLAAPALRRRPSLVLLGVGVAVLTALGFKAGHFLGGSGGETPLAFKQLSYHTGVITAARFAPDGETVLYSAAWDGGQTQVYTTRVDRMGSHSMGLPPAGLWAVSSTGELALALGCSMNWAECIGTLARVPLAGGAPRAVLEDVLGAEWSPDGKRLAIVRSAEGQYRLEYPPGEVIYETPGWIVSPRVSPKGDWIAFIEHPKFGDAGGSLKAVRLGTKQVKHLSDNWTIVVTLAWRPDGEEVWFGGARGRQRMAINGVSLNGAVRLVYDGPGSIRIHDVSSKGRSLVSVVHPRSHVYLQGAGMTEERSLSWLDWATSADLSADGKTLLFWEWGEGVSAKPTIYLRNTDGSDPVRLGEGKPLALSPDGKWVVAIDNAVPSHLILLPTGAGEPRHLPRGSVQEFWWATWFADGKRILFAGNESDRPRSYVQDIDGGDPKPILRPGLAALLVLPDGKRVAAQNLLDGSHSLWPLEGGDPERIPGIQPGEEVLAWAPDGKSFWLRSHDDSTVRLYRVDASTGRRTLWKEIAPPPTGMAGFAPERGGVRITPDGKAWVYSYWRVFHELYLVDGLR